MVSCRPMGDDLLSYGQNDSQVYHGMGKSHAKTFTALWTAMNENYCIWDYEYEHGLDWDAVYHEYLPKFEALDDTSRQENPTAKELTALYSSFLDSLHDGHLAIQIKMDYMSSPITILPSRTRIMRERGEEYEITDKYFTEPDIYEKITGEYHIVQLDEVEGAGFARKFMYRQLDSIIPRCETYLANLEPVKTNESVAKTYDLVSKLLQTALLARNTEAYKSHNADLTLYNVLSTQYKSLGPLLDWEFVSIDKNVMDDPLEFLTVARFEGNILYLRFGSFRLTPHLEKSRQATDTSTFYYAYQQEVIRVWHCWFDAIQKYHAEGNLGGVIIDVRNNGGGYVNDFKFLLGALLPSGGYTAGMMRMKNGIGRYDFSPLLPLVYPTYEGDHAVISEEPIVVISNVQSVSMSENTAWSAKTLANGALVGTRTSGGLCMLNTAPEEYSTTYSGAFGVRDQTPIWGYVPKYVAMYDVENNGEYKIMESIGIAPTENVPFDLQSYQSTGRDNQLEAAIRYINRHK